MEPIENHSNRSMRLILVLLLAAALVAGAAWQITKALQKDTEYGLYKKPLEKVRADLSAKTSVATPSDQTTVMNNVVSYRPSDADFMVSVSNSDGQAAFVVGNSSDAGSGSNAGSAASASSLVSDASQSLENAGYKRIENYPVNALLGEGGMAYEDEKTVCTIASQTTVNVTCADKAQFEAAATDLKEFVELYRANYPDLNEETYAGSYGFLEYGVGDGKGKYAIMSTGNTAAYFYSEDGRWKYYASSSEGLSCAGDFNQNEFAQAAFSKICRPSGAPSS